MPYCPANILAILKDTKCYVSNYLSYHNVAILKDLKYYMNYRFVPPQSGNSNGLFRILYFNFNVLPKFGDSKGLKLK
jgi:hypothetical protein